jgi:hypothetical protein
LKADEDADANGGWGPVKAGREQYAESLHNSCEKPTRESMAVSDASICHSRKHTSQGSDAREEVEFGRTGSSAVVRKTRSMEIHSRANDFDENDGLMTC